MIFLGALASLHFGVTYYPPDLVYHALFANQGTTADSAIFDFRLPRAIIAPLVGACSAVAGVLVQALTRNPLSSPGLLGLNAGAAVFLAIGMIFLGISSLFAISILTISGAFVSCLVVYIVGFAGGQGQMSNTRVILVGFTFSSLLFSFIELVMVIDEADLSVMLQWLSGSFTNKSLDLLYIAGPVIVVGLMIAFFMPLQLDAIMLDDEMAQSIGVPLKSIRIKIFMAVSLLAGSAVMLAGPVGFIGLIVPHISRHFSGLEHKKLLPISALMGAVFALFADIICRFLIYPAEIPVGIVTAVIGVPFFILIISRSSRKSNPQKHSIAKRFARV